MSSFAFLLFFALSISSGFANEKYQDDALKEQNDLRAKHGSPPLVWDEALTKVALKCAEAYAAGKDPHSCPEAEPYGENIAAKMSSKGPPGFDVTAPEGIKQWYDEHKNYNFDDDSKSRGVVGHFTQLIWKESTKTGFACASGTNNWTRCVAIYDPPGNFKGVYKENVGKPK